MPTPEPRSAHDHGNCELCDQLAQECAALQTALTEAHVAYAQLAPVAIELRTERDALQQRVEALGDL